MGWFRGSAADARGLPGPTSDFFLGITPWLLVGIRVTRLLICIFILVWILRIRPIIYIYKFLCFLIIVSLIMETQPPTLIMVWACRHGEASLPRQRSVFTNSSREILVSRVRILPGHVAVVKMLGFVQQMLRVGHFHRFWTLVRSLYEIWLSRDQIWAFCHLFIGVGLRTEIPAGLIIEIDVRVNFADFWLALVGLASLVNFIANILKIVRR